MSGLRFECTLCGACCTARGEYAHVYLDEREAEDLADFLGLDSDTFARRYTFRDEYGWTQLAIREGVCTFLDRETNTCRVYPARPGQCRSFPFWPEYIERGRWTPEAKRLCEGVGRGRLYSDDEVAVLLSEREESERDA
ncbi:MAG: YkgJ family cysteine cluster protein [Proteobacteria bacterium]|nr:YkgJ family cysteine cluster protein [Pseudomonadota bacterium]